MQQPLYILAGGSSRTHGQAAQDSNIRAGKAVANAVRTTLGPRGMDKMLVDSSGTVVITNDGATILEEMDIEHPAAQMIVEVAETQEEAVGDGTTTAAVLTGELLVHAEDLLEQDLHPTVIVEGYTEAARLAQEAIDAQVLDATLDDDLLEKVAESSMTGKGTGDVTADVLATHVVRAVRMVHEENDGRFDSDDVRVLTRTGASSSATELVEGVVIDKDPVNDNMPRSVEDATVAVLDAKLDVRKGEVDTEYNITSVEQLDAAIKAEDDELRGYAKAFADAGVDVLFCTKSVSDRVAGYLAKEGVLAFKNVKQSDARAIARATGAKRLGSATDVDESDFGHADAVSLKTYGDDDLTFVEGGAASKAVTLFLRGGTEHVVDELERAIEDAIGVVVAALDKGGVVPGAGATEIAIADHVRSEAAGIEGRKQLAVEAFADAVEALPRTLAENTGMDPIDALVDLRARFEKEGVAGVISSGRAGEIGDPVEHGILDPAAVKREAVESATEAATMIVRIDDVIAAE
ncbi:thermosome subunit alpha [Halogeometricum sp. CBA1124]|uniref:thermosome subunit alpha n=1 Tax=Halogeometricum sp. CBA1124 TaxID=2668071 RepID=UPI00142A5ED9|nr:thermosome subunit alpha [Halogeometricum sp. CBA1124]MUV57266.1 thermosome subunit [Halogeometricum sp. CBA1124]